MYLLISHTDPFLWLTIDYPQKEDNFSLVQISSGLDVFPIIVWQNDGSIDYLETNRFGDVLRRDFVWYPLRFGEKPICRAFPVKIAGLAFPQVAFSRLERLIKEKLTFQLYRPAGFSIYYDFHRPFYRSGNKFFDAVSGQNLKIDNVEIEEIVCSKTHRSYFLPSRVFNLVLVYRPKEKALYLYNAKTGIRLNKTEIYQICSGENQEYSLGEVVGQTFYRPNPNMARRFYKYLPSGPLTEVERVPVIRWA